jgi:hypothetical protein
MCTGPFRATDHNGDDAPECRSAAIANAARPVVGATRGAGPRRAFCGVFGASSRSTERKSVPPTGPSHQPTGTGIGDSKNTSGTWGISASITARRAPSGTSVSMTRSPHQVDHFGRVPSGASERRCSRNSALVVASPSQGGTPASTKTSRALVSRGRQRSRAGRIRRHCAPPGRSAPSLSAGALHEPRHAARR